MFPSDLPNFNDSFERSRNRFRRIHILIIAGIVVMILGYGAMFMKAKNSGKTFYTIEVVTFNQHNFFQSDSIISQTPNNVHFIDMFGRNQYVSGETIIVTGY
jgi:hypothetical protein